MALKRVTMQDVADACGLSRNTVSKIFNQRGSVPEATKKLVLAKAQELGYSLSAAAALPANSDQIAVLTQHKMLTNHFGGYFLTSFADQLSRAGYAMKIFEVSTEEIARQELPPHLNLNETVGILGVELFDRSYLDMVCALGKPTVFVDGNARASRMPINCDFVSMENVASETALVERMIAAGARHLGFVGDKMHCNSFNERWIGFFLALREAGLPVDPDLCILDKDSPSYADPDWLLARLDAMPELPDGFACANDFLAIHLMAALKRKGLSIPADVMVTGFDGSLNASLADPPLTTALIPGAEIGRLAASLLCEKIRFPDRSFRWVNVKTVPLWKNSTR